MSRGRHPLVSWGGFENHWIPRGVSCGPWTEPNQCLALCSIHTCCVCRNVCFVLLLFCLPFGVYVCLQIHCGSAFAQGPLQNTLLLRATRMRPQLFGRASGVASLVTNKQTNETCGSWLVRSCRLTYKQHSIVDRFYPLSGSTAMSRQAL